MVIAIDGPGGVGKTTVSRRVGEALGLAVLDTGAIYRAATLAVLRAGVDPADERSVVEVVGESAVRFDEGRTYLDGEDVSCAIRRDDVTGSVSEVSAFAGVRERLVALQRQWVEERGGAAVVEGRDIGTVVFPEASVKVFLTARPEIRAARRARQDGGEDAGVLADLARRDRADSGRAVSPLRPAHDAVVIDTSDIGIEEVVQRILELAS